jgi:hypothetical protein
MNKNLTLDTSGHIISDHLIKFFIFLKKLIKKKRDNIWGGYGHALGTKGVAKTMPKPPLGVVSATPLTPWGGRNFSLFFFGILKK